MDWATRVCLPAVAGISQTQVVYTVLRISDETLQHLLLGLSILIFSFHKMREFFD
jgi:hypothetical protein